MSSELEQAEKDRDELYDLLRWTHGILAVVLQEAGGTIEIAEKDLAAIDLNKSNIMVNFDESRDVYIVEGRDIETE